MISLCSIASGSSGNCTVIGSGGSTLLVDAGISGKKIENGLRAIGTAAEHVDCILVTHEHADHIAGLGVLMRRFHLPVYATAGTIREIEENASVGTVDRSLFHPITAGKDFAVKDMIVTPIPMDHDAADPVCFRLRCKEHSAAVVTDLGEETSSLLKALCGLDLLLLEANYDPYMLQSGPYPPALQERIRGRCGHLCNEQSGHLLSRLLHDGFGGVLLGHLSKENNTAELAYETVRIVVTDEKGPYRAEDFPMYVAPRDGVSAVLSAG